MRARRFAPIFGAMNRARSHPGPAPDAFRIASYNMHKGVGADGRRDPARIAGVLAEIDADIVALQEADRRFGDMAGVLDLDAVRALTGLAPIPLERRGRAHGWRGNLVLLRNIDVERVEQIDLPGLEPRGAVMIDIIRAGQPLRVVAAHLGLLRRSRLAQAQALSEVLAAEPPRPTLLAGDLNEWRLTRRSSLEPLMPHAPGALVKSFPARRPLLALDRILACPATDVIEMSSHDTPLARVASDHLPVKAWIRARDGSATLSA